MAYPIFDSHTHYDSRRFRRDGDMVLASLPEKGVGWVVNCGMNLESSLRSMALAERYDHVWFAAGYHPHNAVMWDGDSEARLRELLAHPKCVAIGETGLDYHRYLSPADAQKAVFERHLQIAADTGKALVLHCRRAHDDMMDILRGYAPLRGVMHCFCDGQRELEEILELGLHIGLGGAVTYEYSAETLEAIARLPAERLMLETDCPYLVPAPCVGKRCESPVIAVTAEYVAQAMNLSAEEVLRAAAENAGRLYGIDISE